MNSLIFLFNYLISMGFNQMQATELTCIAFEESSFRIEAIHYNDNHTTDHGLFQINDVWLKECNATPQSLLEFKQNVKCATKLYRRHSARIWSTAKYCQNN